MKPAAYSGSMERPEGLPSFLKQKWVAKKLGPHFVAALTGINPGKFHGQGPWVSHRKHRLDDKLVSKHEDTFLLDILMMEVRLQRMSRLERSRLGLQMILDVFSVAPPSPYMLG